MKLLALLAVLSVSCVVATGCSPETKQETKEALSATGEAVQSAAQDAKENAAKLGNAVEAGIERGKEEFKNSDSHPERAHSDAEPAPAPSTGDQ